MGVGLCNFHFCIHVNPTPSFKIVSLISTFFNKVSSSKYRKYRRISGNIGKYATLLCYYFHHKPYCNFHRCHTIHHPTSYCSNYIKNHKHTIGSEPNMWLKRNGSCSNTCHFSNFFVCMNFCIRTLFPFGETRFL